MSLLCAGTVCRLLIERNSYKFVDFFVPRTFSKVSTEAPSIILSYQCSIKAPPSFVVREENSKVNLDVQQTVK